MLSFLATIESIGRKLPHPTLVFIYLCGIVIAGSYGLSFLGLSATHPVTQELLTVKSLLSPDGLLYILSNTVHNFMNFAPLGPVLVAMLGIGIADHSGYLPAGIQTITNKAPKSLLSYAIVFCGVLSNIAADSGYVVLIPLAALVFKTAGRHPLAGIAAGFAGVSGGYSANLLLGPVDIVLAGITTEAAQILEPTASISAASNYWFMVASTFIITFLGGLLTDKIVEPYLAANNTELLTDTDQALQNQSAKKNQSMQQKPIDRKAFAIATLAGLVYCLVLGGIFYIQLLPFQEAISGLVVLITLGFAIVGLVYGRLATTPKQDNWVVTSLESSFAALAGYMVLMFFAAQFVAYFNWTQLGLIAAIKGATLLTSWSLPPIMLLLVILLFSATINLCIGSSSAKWALLAPVLVPLLMLLDIDPALTQLAYRIGDSSTNIITPLMPYFALVLAYAQQHKQDTHLGTIMAMMMPYSIGFLVVWSLTLVVWVQAGVPLGF